MESSQTSELCLSRGHGPGHAALPDPQDLEQVWLAMRAMQAMVGASVSTEPQLPEALDKTPQPSGRCVREQRGQGLPTAQTQTEAPAPSLQRPRAAQLCSAGFNKP